MEHVTAKILANIPALAGMYLLQQQTALAAGLQNGAMMNITPVKKGADAVNAPPLPVTNVETGLKNKADGNDNEPEENELLDFSFGM